MISFEAIWTLLSPSENYRPVRRRCQTLWESFPPEKQQEIYCRIEKKKKERKFIDYNPLFAIQKNALPPRPRQEVLTYDAYYSRFGTTEEQGGWRRVFIEKERKTIYVSGMARE